MFSSGPGGENLIRITARNAVRFHHTADVTADVIIGNTQANLRIRACELAGMIGGTSDEKRVLRNPRALS